MIKTEYQMVKTEVMVDVTCDCCGKSCMDEYGGNTLKLESYWGFSTKKDLEHWEAHLCEQCVDEKLSFINFTKTPYGFA
jgi:hypothetical protein